MNYDITFRSAVVHIWEVLFFPKSNHSISSQLMATGNLGFAEREEVSRKSELGNWPNPNRDIPVQADASSSLYSFTQAFFFYQSFQETTFPSSLWENKAFRLFEGLYEGCLSLRAPTICSKEIFTLHNPYSLHAFENKQQNRNRSKIAKRRRLLLQCLPFDENSTDKNSAK